MVKGIIGNWDTERYSGVAERKFELHQRRRYFIGNTMIPAIEGMRNDSALIGPPQH